MTVAEFFTERWEYELPAFGRVLRALPGDRLDYKPHERSTSAGDLAWQLAQEQRSLAILLEKGTFQWEAKPRPATLEGIIEAWDEATRDLRTQLKSYDDNKGREKVTMTMPGAPDWTDTTSNMLWGFLFDMVHHRGQLSTYLRPMGGKVPSIYGPSGDDSGMQ